MSEEKRKAERAKERARQQEEAKKRVSVEEGFASMLLYDLAEVPMKH